MFGAFIVITVVGFLLYGIVSLAEAIAIPWHISRRRARIR
jgi:ABC-type nitrate/sulfonate/bicarbonate transport system permease component